LLPARQTVRRADRENELRVEDAPDFDALPKPAEEARVWFLRGDMHDLTVTVPR
jgi:hypothetical protein